MKKVCYFGAFDPEYSRNKILIRGLAQNNCLVYLCHDNSGGINHYIKLFKNFVKNYKDCDAILVGAVCLYDVPLAWLLGKLFSKKVLYDAFISLYNTYVFDRTVIKKFSLPAFKIYLWEYTACHLADIVYLDTWQHVQYFIHTFHLKKDKMAVIYIGADEEIFFPTAVKNTVNSVIVEFYGSYQPLQGVEYIIQAAKILKDDKKIKFRLYGEGQTKKAIEELAKQEGLKNVVFFEWKSLYEIKASLEKANIALGIFGKTVKANLVIPNKGYEALAMGKVLITMRSKAAEELLVNMDNAVLVDNQNPADLAAAIKKLADYPQLREKIAHKGYQLFKEKLTSKVLGEKLVKLVT